MDPGKAKAREIDRQKVRGILANYDPTIETRTSLFHAVTIEEHPRDTLLVTIALRPNEALVNDAVFVATMNAEFTRKFPAKTVTCRLET